MGKIEVITGCMFSGKSEELIRRLKRAQIAKQTVQVFKPAIDTRYSKIEVVSHTGYKIDAIPVKNSKELINKVNQNTMVIGIDEAQFFDNEIVNVLRKLSGSGKRIIVAGLDMDFRGEPFGPMPYIMSIADEVTKLHAICTICGEDATMTQRLINGKPASYDDELILVGGSESYEARCKKHHIVTGTPQKTSKIISPNSKLLEDLFEELLDNLQNDVEEITKTILSDLNVTIEYKEESIIKNRCREYISHLKKVLFKKGGD